MKNQLLKRRKERIVKSQVRRIIDAFDFEKVHKAMQVLGLGWQTRAMSNAVTPSVNELKKRAERELTQVGMSEGDDWHSIEGGGLCADRYPDGTIILRFSIESWEELP